MNLIELKRAFSAGKLDKATFIRRAYQCHQTLFDYTSVLDETNIRSIEVSDEGVCFSFRDPDIRLWSPEGDTRTAPIEALNFGGYEERELTTVLRLIESLNDSPGALVDIGANIGYYAIAIAKAFPDREIIAFEPIPSTFELLERNVKLNQAASVRLVNQGLSNQSGEISFFLTPSQSAAASAVNLLDDENAKEIRCRIETLDAFSSTLNGPVKFIKCDVEGGELFAFQGGADTIQRDHPIIFSEMLRKWCAKLDYHPNDIVKLLDGFGYDCCRLTDSGLRACDSVDENTRETNFVFLHRDEHAAQADAFSTRD